MSKYHHITSTSVRGYRINDGYLTIVDIPIIDGEPVDNYGAPLISDNKTVVLMGWPDPTAESFCGNRLFIGLDQLEV